MNTNQSQNNHPNIVLWKCKHCESYNYPTKTQCKACFYDKSPLNDNIPRTKPIQILQQQQQNYESVLDIILKRALIVELTVYGYIRQYYQFYPKEIIQIIYNFYFIKILKYKIQGIGYNAYGQLGIGKSGTYEEVETLTTLKTYKKQIKNIINGNC
eukprot:489283_1